MIKDIVERMKEFPLDYAGTRSSFLCAIDEDKPFYERESMAREFMIRSKWLIIDEDLLSFSLKGKEKEDAVEMYKEAMTYVMDRFRPLGDKDE